MNSPAKNELKCFNHLLTGLDAVYHEASLRFGLSDSAMQILYTLCVCGGRCRLSDIIKMSSVSKQTIHSSIHKLEQDGILRLELHNKKSKLVFLTEKGQEFTASTALPLVAMENQVFDAWTEAERQDFFRLLQKYQNDLKSRLSTYFDGEEKEIV